MISNFFNTSRIAGILLLLSVLLLLVGLGFVVAQDKLAGMAVAFRGVGPPFRDASGLRIMTGFALPSFMALLAGFALFAMLLYQAGNRGLALIALVLLICSVAVAAISSSFHASVTVWAAANAGSAPEFYEPLRRWMNNEVQITYVSIFLVAMFIFSISVLRVGIISSRLGSIALAWSIFAFPFYLGRGLPVIIFVSPMLFGIGLLLRGGREMHTMQAERQVMDKGIR